MGPGRDVFLMGEGGLDLEGTMGEALPSENFFFLTIFSFETMAAPAILVATVERRIADEELEMDEEMPFFLGEGGGLNPGARAEAGCLEGIIVIDGS
jgi:hypothetical protein